MADDDWWDDDPPPSTVCIPNKTDFSNDNNRSEEYSPRGGGGRGFRARGRGRGFGRGSWHGPGDSKSSFGGNDSQSDAEKMIVPKSMLGKLIGR